MSHSYSATKYLANEEKIHSFDEMPGILRKLRAKGVTSILAQGVFDIVHMGHVGYLRAAQAVDSANGIVIVGIENDESVRLNKGNTRPINTAEERSQLLSEFISVGLVFTYDDAPRYDKPQDYIDRYKALNPASIVVPIWDPHRDLKEWQARKAKTRLSLVNYKHVNSTTLMLQKIGYQE